MRIAFADRLRGGHGQPRRNSEHVTGSWTIGGKLFAMFTASEPAAGSVGGSPARPFATFH
jgi:hypothetical protein